jgi:hypothetical protein
MYGHVQVTVGTENMCSFLWHLIPAGPLACDLTSSSQKEITSRLKVFHALSWSFHANAPIKKQEKERRNEKTPKKPSLSEIGIWKSESL